MKHLLLALFLILTSCRPDEPDQYCARCRALNDKHGYDRTYCGDEETVDKFIEHDITGFKDIGITVICDKWKK